MLFERLLKQVALGLGMQLSLAHVPVHSKDVQIIVARLGSFQAKWEVLGRWTGFGLVLQYTENQRGMFLKKLQCECWRLKR